MNEQIEKRELSESIYMSGYGLDRKDCDDIAEQLYHEGYRKQSEGEWIWEHDALNDPKRYFVRVVCTCCGLKTGQTSNFCPKCGAKMKGGAE